MIKALTLQKTGWFIFWSAIIGLSVYFYAEIIGYYSKGEFPSNFKLGFWYSKIWYIGHIAGASASLILGPLQFWERFRSKYMTYHRTAGKIFVVGSLIASICAFRIVLIYDCVPCRVSLGILSILWFFFTFTAYWSIRRKNVKAHRQFMARSYTAALAFVFIRIFGLIGYDRFFPFLDNRLEQRTTAEWLCWVVPLLVVEFYLSWRPLLNLKSKLK